MRRSGALVALTSATLLTLASRLGAQSQLTVAKEKSAVIPVQSGFISLDLAEERLGIQRFRSRNTGLMKRDTVCGIVVPRIRDRAEWTLGAGIAAKKGKGSLIAAGDPTPGLDIAVTHARFFEGGYVPPAPAECRKDGFDPKSKGYDATFVTLSTEVVGRKVATLTGTSATQSVDFEDKQVGGKAILLLGWNHAVDEDRVFGLTVDGGREWRSPGDDEPQSSCTLTGTGTDADGKTRVVQDCKDRYVGPLPDVWRGQVRMTYSSSFIVPTDTTRPSLGVIVGATATARTLKAPSYSVAAGYTLHPADKPSNIFGAALLELADLTNTGGKSPTLWSMMNLRLVLGLPFK